MQPSPSPAIVCGNLFAQQFLLRATAELAHGSKAVPLSLPAPSDLMFSENLEAEVRVISAHLCCCARCRRVCLCSRYKHTRTCLFVCAPRG
jgi:hypothetical protein